MDIINFTQVPITLYSQNYHKPESVGRGQWQNMGQLMDVLAPSVAGSATHRNRDEVLFSSLALATPPSRPRKKTNRERTKEQWPLSYQNVQQRYVK